MSSIARLVADLVGKPYRLGGRGPHYFDCAGLVIEVQRRIGRAQAIPETPVDEVAQATSMQRILSAHWESVGGPEPGAVVYLQPAHVGVMVSRTHFLHTTSETGAALIEDLRSPLWKRRASGYFIPKGGLHA